MSAITTIKATGLTCHHCAMSVQEELQEIENITDVKVEVVKDGESIITITHEAELSPEAISEAITEAGFTAIL